MTEYLLSDLLKIKNGKDHKHLADGKFPVYGSGGIMRYANEFLYDKESILLPRKGSLANIQYANKPFWTVDTIYYTVINNELADSYYLYNYLKLLDLSNLNSGTGVPSMTFGAYYGLKINLPSLKVQKQIAKVLSDLDAKIEINNKINAELEAMAKLIYDYWFVQFDFPISAAYAASIGRPDLAGKPYKSSGGKMVYNERLKREIPEGWEDGVLGDFIELNYGKGLKKSERSGEGFPVVGSSGIVGYHSTPIVKGPGIVVGRKGTIGKITYMYEDFYPIDTTYYVSPKLNIGFSYLFFLLNSLPLDEMNSDSAVPGLNRSRALTTPLCFIPENKIASFEEFADPIFDMIEKNKTQNYQLAKLRDWLLPMLMNGQVKVQAKWSVIDQG